MNEESIVYATNSINFSKGNINQHRGYCREIEIRQDELLVQSCNNTCFAVTLLEYTTDPHVPLLSTKQIYKLGLQVLVSGGKSSYKKQTRTFFRTSWST